MRRYDVVFSPRKINKTLKLREIGSKHVGKLVTVQVRPPSTPAALFNGSLPVKGCKGCKRGLQLANPMQGIITHMTDVKPLISVATYVDDDTGFEVYQPITGLALQALIHEDPIISNLLR